MNKKISLVILVTGVFASFNAHASRARILVEGTGDAGVILGSGGSTGSFTHDDDYNIFYNPSYIADHKNWAIIEKSNFSPAANTLSNGTTGEGGFAKDFGPVSAALFFNRQDALNDASYSNQSAMRPVDLIIGGSARSVHWGLGATYSAYTTPNPNLSGNTVTATDLVLRAGLTWNDFEPFASWRPVGTDSGLVTTPANHGYVVGARYHVGDFVPFAAYRNDSYNSITNYRAFGLGVGRAIKVSEEITLSANIGWFRQSVGANVAGTNGNLLNGSTVAGDRSVTPLNIDAECSPLQWLTVRGGLGYNFLDRVGGTTLTDNTSARIGATAHAGHMDFDMAVGTGTSTANATEATTSPSTQAFDLAHGFVTAAALDYRW